MPKKSAMFVALSCALLLPAISAAQETVVPLPVETDKTVMYVTKDSVIFNIQDVYIFNGEIKYASEKQDVSEQTDNEVLSAEDTLILNTQVAFVTDGEMNFACKEVKRKLLKPKTTSTKTVLQTKNVSKIKSHCVSSSGLPPYTPFNNREGNSLCACHSNSVPLNNNNNNNNQNQEQKHYKRPQKRCNYTLYTQSPFLQCILIPVKPTETISNLATFVPAKIQSTFLFFFGSNSPPFC
ncbi:MAG: hypothetical protein LBV52_03895 [Spirochaetaceae bacterium]|nr:hypothetical protein [Spirochaetaceae bacterium]